MLDAVLLLKAMGGAAATAAGILLLLGWPGRSDRAARCAAGWTLGMGFGFAVGCWILNVSLRWPPREDQDRFLLLVMPAVFTLELLASIPRVSRWPILALRLLLIAGVAPVLLHGSVYLSDAESAERWSPAQKTLILGGMAAMLATAWCLLASLQRRVSGRSLPLALAFTCMAAGATVMLSGYLSGGLLALPLAAALTGTVAASRLLSPTLSSSGWLGPTLVGLFGLLVAGHFFADLTGAHALALFAAPLLGWLPEAPGFRRLSLPWRDCVRFALIAAAATAVVVLAHKKSTHTVSLSRAAMGASSLK